MTLTLHRILVPVDFSEFSRKAVLVAIDMASQSGASIDLLHVWEPPALRPDLMVWAEADGATLWETAKQNAGEEMRAFVASLPENSVARSDVLTGNPAETIAQRARSEGHDLIVLGTHGRTGLKHLLIGSVAEKVVRHASCPVLTVRGSA